jgi:lysozyme
LNNLRELLKLHEGFSAKPYRDSVGKLTIGYGFNLDDVGLYPEECEFILANRIKKLDTEMRRMLPWFAKLDDVRKVVLLDMCYNMGPEPFDFDGYKDWPIFLGQVERGEYVAAAKNMRSTLWYRQVKGRGVRLARMMETGKWPVL